MEARSAYVQRNKQYRTYKKFNTGYVRDINTEGTAFTYFGKIRHVCVSYPGQDLIGNYDNM